MEGAPHNLNSFDSIKESLTIQLADIQKREDALFEKYKGQTVPVSELRDLFEEGNGIRKQLQELEQIKKESETVDAIENTINKTSKEADDIFPKNI